MLKIAILGGGAAGMMSALVAKERLGDQAEVVLLERNKMLGVKVAISGGGRCNVTTGKTKLAEVLQNYPRGSEFCARL